MRPLTRPSFLPLLPMSVLGIVLLAGCDREAAPTASTAENFGIVPEEAGDASAGLGPPELPPGVEDLPIEERPRTVLVDFPAVDDVGICHTQVASQSRTGASGARAGTSRGSRGAGSRIPSSPWRRCGVGFRSTEGPRGFPMPLSPPAPV